MSNSARLSILAEDLNSLYVEELSRSPRPPMNSSPPWIIPAVSGERDSYRTSTRAGPYQDGYLSGPCLQSSASPSPSSSHSRHDTRVTPYSSSCNSPSGRDNPAVPQHPQHHHMRQECAPFDSMQRRLSHDHVAPPPTPHTYFNQNPQPYSGNTHLLPAGAPVRHVTPVLYPDSRMQLQRREMVAGPSTSDGHYNSPPTSVSTMKYECEYCGKGFTRPSSLKIHLNSHTGEKPFVCTYEGCGRSFSVLSNMRRHARVHAEPSGRQNDVSGDELSDRHSPAEH
ncbi:hypothetical protein ID866_758 [Astraeus odoratus]|nr:hypothetical protein ID866_758 [Astraeus odoratus]